jgi:propanediol utilization protein
MESMSVERQGRRMTQTTPSTLPFSSKKRRMGGAICAMRHIHMSPEDAENYGVRDRWLESNFEAIGRRSSVDLRSLFM